MPDRGSEPRLEVGREGYPSGMMKLVIFAGGVAVGCAVGTALSEEQRRKVQDRISHTGDGPRAKRLKSAAMEVTGSVADDLGRKASSTT